MPDDKNATKCEKKKSNIADVYTVESLVRTNESLIFERMSL